MSEHQAGALAFAGRLQQARTLSQHAIDAAQQTGYKERAGFFATRVALREAFYGNVQAAQQWAKKARELGKGREVEYGAAFALALSGASSQAEGLANDLEKRFPEDTAVRFSYLPALSARLALNRHQPSKAIEKLQSASHYELGSPPAQSMHVSAPCIRRMYVVRHISPNIAASKPQLNFRRFSTTAES